MRTVPTNQGTIEILQIFVKSSQKGTLRTGVQSSNCVVNKICVKLAELCQICGIRVGCIAIDRAIVGTWGHRVLGGEKFDTTSDDINGNGCVGPKEPIWETAVLKESSCNVHVELQAFIATVDKECEGEYGLGVCGEDSGRDEAELGIGGDGILDSLEPEFCGHREVVETGTKLVTEGGELKEIIISNLYLG